MYSGMPGSRTQSRPLSNPPYSAALPGGAEYEEHKIVGKDLDDCRAQLFNMYKQNYTITGTKQILKPGFLGWRQKELLEARYIIGKIPETPREESFQESRDAIIAKNTGAASITTTIQISQLDKKFEETKKGLEEKMNLILQATKAESKPASIAKIEELLQGNEFTFEYINRITTRLRAELTMEELEDFSYVQKTVVDWIGESIKITPNLPHKYPQVIILVGPTGVGKTTTIAKLAGTLIKEAKDSERKRPVIKMVTIDHTRVGAVEQLFRFSDIMMADFCKAESAKDVEKIFKECRDNIDVMFIDTPGFSPNDHENIGKMTKILEARDIHPDIYLTFSASTKARDLDSILRNYESCNYKSVIITKCDETTAFGNVISVLAKKGKEITYITDGQQVPNKIKRASVIQFLINLADFEIDRDHIDEKFPEDNNYGRSGTGTKANDVQQPQD